MTIPITNTTTFSPHSSLSFLFFYFHFDTDWNLILVSL
jgi:hypothetical protein